MPATETSSGRNATPFLKEAALGRANWYGPHGCREAFLCLGPSGRHQKIKRAGTTRKGTLPSCLSKRLTDCEGTRLCPSRWGAHVRRRHGPCRRSGARRVKSAGHSSSQACHKIFTMLWQPQPQPTGSILHTLWTNQRTLAICSFSNFFCWDGVSTFLFQRYYYTGGSSVFSLHCESTSVVSFSFLRAWRPSRRPPWRSSLWWARRWRKRRVTPVQPARA